MTAPIDLRSATATDTATLSTDGLRPKRCRGVGPGACRRLVRGSALHWSAPSALLTC